MHNWGIYNIWVQCICTRILFSQQISSFDLLRLYQKHLGGFSCQITQIKKGLKCTDSKVRQISGTKKIQTERKQQQQQLCKISQTWATMTTCLPLNFFSSSRTRRVWQKQKTQSKWDEAKENYCCSSLCVRQDHRENTTPAATSIGL